MAYTPRAPIRLNTVQDVAARYPDDFDAAGHGSTAFVEAVVRELSTTDGDWRLVGQRGDPTDISEDAIGYVGHAAQGSPVVDQLTGVHGEVIDIIASSTAPPGSSGRKPTWGDETAASAPHTAWVFASAAPAPPPSPPPVGPARLVSPNGRVVLQAQNDGNVVQYNDNVAVWASGQSLPPGSDPLPPAGNLSQMPEFRGNFQFLYKGPTRSHYIASGFAMRTDAEIDGRILWLKVNGYNVELLNLTQWQWSRPPGGDIYTRNTRDAPVVEAARSGVYENRPVVGWRHNTDEYVKIVNMYRRAGIEVVLGLFEYPTMADSTDRSEAMAAIPRLGAALDPHVVGVQCFWEGDEVMGTRAMWSVTSRVQAAFPTSTVGPHFASGTPDYVKDFFVGPHGCTGYFHQYVDKDSNSTPSMMKKETQDIVSVLPDGVLLVAHEHSQSRAEGFTHDQSRDRAQACIDAGAAGSLNG